MPHDARKCAHSPRCACNAHAATPNRTAPVLVCAIAARLSDAPALSEPRGASSLEATPRARPPAPGPRRSACCTMKRQREQPRAVVDAGLAREAAPTRRVNFVPARRALCVCAAALRAADAVSRARLPDGSGKSGGMRLVPLNPSAPKQARGGAVARAQLQTQIARAGGARWMLRALRGELPVCCAALV